MERSNGIILAMFGTSVESALSDLLSVRDAAAIAFPFAEVRLAFTSSMLRSRWHQRAADVAYRTAHPAVDPAIFAIQSPLAAIAELQDAGFGNLVVQPIHIAPAEEYHDLRNLVAGLAAIGTLKSKNRLFSTLVIGRPALGAPDAAYPYAEDILTAAQALAQDVELAARKQAALLYMGHGSRCLPVGGAYLELAARMNALYPGTGTYVGTVEGFPGVELVLEQLRRDQVQRVVLKPLLVAAGGHAIRDMIGPAAYSWQNRLAAAGIEVHPVLEGLGAQESFIRIFIEHAAQAAEAAGLKLR